MHGEFWRSQALNDLMPLWFEHVIDREHGGFFLNLSRDWQPRAPWEKAPPMLSRQVYTFSAAFLLSGDEKYLAVARDGADYVIEHAWDAEYGGWFDRIAETGEPLLTTKSVPEQLYTGVGLTLYAFTTGDERVLSYVQRGDEIRSKQAHDPVFGGYYEALNRDLSVLDPGKNKHAHFGYVSSLVLNLYLATRDPAVLAWEEELTDLSLDRMRDAEGWIHGWPDRFDRRWNLLPVLAGGKQLVAVGAQLTASLSFLRLFHQSGKDRYRQAGEALGNLVTQWGFNPETGAWTDFVEALPPHKPIVSADSGSAGGYYQQLSGPSISWWVQIYGAFLQLQLFRVTGNPACLENFRKTEEFFLRHFVDHEYGGVFATVSAKGELIGDGAKASDWHASYHEIEHGLLNYLYLNLYVERKPARLFFRSDGRGGKRFVSLVDDPAVTIAGVTIDGRPWADFNAAERSVTLPVRGESFTFEVTFAPAP